MSLEDAEQRIASHEGNFLSLFGLDLSTVPDSITQLANLNILNLDGNQLQWLPRGMASLGGLTGVELGRRNPSRGQLVLGPGNQFPAELIEAAEAGIEELWAFLRDNDPPTDEEPVESDESDRPSTVREAVGTDLEFDRFPDPATILDVRGLLEQLVGLTTELIQQGRFENDMLVEERIGRDCESLRYELFENPDVDATMIATVTQRTLATIIPVLDDGPQKDLLQAIASTPDLNPTSAEAAESALDKAQQVTEALEERLDEAEDLVELLGDRFEDLPPDINPPEWVAASVNWNRAIVEGVSLTAGITGTLVALGASGGIAIALGAIFGLWAFFRPRSQD